MSPIDDQNEQLDQYRRAQHHPDDSPIDIRPTIDRKQLLRSSAMLLGLALLMFLGLALPFPQKDTQEDHSAQVHLDTVQALSADCAVIQHMAYTPCGHSVTRRQMLPTELAGKSHAELTAAYDTWQVTAFSPVEVVMERRLDMFCPQHAILLPDENGMLCIWENCYGDALAIVAELGTAVSELPETLQTEVRSGKGFDSQEALEKWLESVES